MLTFKSTKMNFIWFFNLMSVDGCYIEISD